MLVGLSGSIGSGKTTFSEFLGEDVANHQHWESWKVIAEIASGLREQELPTTDPHDLGKINAWLAPLPTLVAEVTHRTMSQEDALLTYEKVQARPELYDKLFEYTELMVKKPELQLMPVTEDRKEQLRSILQWLGGYLAKTVGGDIWYGEIVRRIEAVPHLDLATVGGVRFPADAEVLRKHHGHVLKIVRPDSQKQDSSDITEREADLIEPDAMIYNDGSLEQLRHCSKTVLHDLGNKALQPEYYASQF